VKAGWDLYVQLREEVTFTADLLQAKRSTYSSMLAGRVMFLQVAEIW
jgi:hypothetical protein